MRELIEMTLGEALGSGALSGLCTGRVVRMTPNGSPLVDFPGNTQGPVQARSVVATWPAGLGDDCHAATVLLCFENADAHRPIILGFVCDRLERAPVEQTLTPTQPAAWSTRVDGNQVVFEARDEIVLRCGRSSITLLKDGKIILKGIDIVSRASESNKIRGANVRIN